MRDATSQPVRGGRGGGGRGALGLFLVTLLTYPRRPWLWCWPLGSALLCAFVSSRIAPMYDAHSTGLSGADPLPFDGAFFASFLLACSVGFFAASVTGHFLQLLTPPLGQTVPRLRRAALAADILLTLSILVGVTAIWPQPTVHFGTGAGGPPHDVLVSVHALALASLVAAQLAWTQLAPITGACSLFAWGALAFPAAREVVLRMLLGLNFALEGTMAALGAALFVALWVTIARRRDRTSAVDPFAELILRKLFGGEARTASSPAPVAGAIPAVSAPRTAWSRRRLHRRAAAGGSPPVATGLVAGLSLVALVYALRLAGLEKMDASTPRVLFFLASILPAVVVSVCALENRGPLVSHGLLLPHHRRQFIRELGLAMLVNLFTAWVTASVPVLLLITFDVPAHVRLAPAALAGMVAIAAGYQLFAFGVIAWLLRLNHRIAVIIVQAAGCALGVPILIDTGRLVVHAAAVIPAAFAVTGLALALTAYHRWAHSEPPAVGPSKTAAAL